MHSCGVCTDSDRRLLDLHNQQGKAFKLAYTSLIGTILNIVGVLVSPMTDALGFHCIMSVAFMVLSAYASGEMKALSCKIRKEVYGVA